jgi:hypothetical protein
MALRTFSAFAAFALSLTALPAFAQKDVFFGDGKPPLYQESETDRRFTKSKVNKALTHGTADANCVQLLGGLLTALAEVGPTLHNRDENFTLDPVLLEAVNTQLTTNRFPAVAYLAAMVRRVMIDRKLPDEWLTIAEQLNKQVQIIDVGKLRYLNDGIHPIDSFTFTLPALRERYDLEVKRATAIAQPDAAAEFRDVYLDREIAWGALTLLEIAPAKRRSGDEAESLEAILEWTPPQPQQHQLILHAVKKTPGVKVIARLAVKQYLDLAKVPRGKRMLVRGRFWEMNRGLTEVEVRDALLFEDRDWSRGVLLAENRAAFSCPFASNELTGVAPKQPGGFKHR